MDTGSGSGMTEREGDGRSILAIPANPHTTKFLYRCGYLSARRERLKSGHDVLLWFVPRQPGFVHVQPFYAVGCVCPAGE